MENYTMFFIMIFMIYYSFFSFTIEGVKSVGVGTYIMLPLNTVKQKLTRTEVKDLMSIRRSPSRSFRSFMNEPNFIKETLQLRNEEFLNHAMDKLVSTGVEGIMSDCWWGLVEREPRLYDFSPYQRMAEMAQEKGLKIQMTLSFHKCGGNVGDTCLIELPEWIERQNNDIFYKDREGRQTDEYISLFAAQEHAQVDSLKRTPYQIYMDFMKAFRKEVVNQYPDVITEVIIGAGPAGEIRYPSYQMDKNWRYPQLGEFQSYDKYAHASIKEYAELNGRPEWGIYAGPSNSKQYCDNQVCYVKNTFFDRNSFDSFASPYGDFYLSWYSNKLLQHAKTLSKIARHIFPDVPVAMKVAGIHWAYQTDHHGAELTAGYYNTNGKNFYLQLARILASFDVGFCFTCMEMNDEHDHSLCRSKPEQLIHQVREAVSIAYKDFHKAYIGENALPLYNNGQIKQIRKSMHGGKHFTLLRLTEQNFDYGLVQNLVGELSQTSHRK